MKDEDLDRASPAFRYALDRVGPRRDPALATMPSSPASSRPDRDAVIAAFLLSAQTSQTGPVPRQLLN